MFKNILKGLVGMFIVILIIGACSNGEDEKAPKKEEPETKEVVPKEKAEKEEPVPEEEEVEKEEPKTEEEGSLVEEPLLEESIEEQIYSYIPGRNFAKEVVIKDGVAYIHYYTFEEFHKIVNGDQEKLSMYSNYFSSEKQGDKKLVETTAMVLRKFPDLVAVDSHSPDGKQIYVTQHGFNQYLISLGVPRDSISDQEYWAKVISFIVYEDRDFYINQFLK